MRRTPDPEAVARGRAKAKAALEQAAEDALWEEEERKDREREEAAQKAEQQALEDEWRAAHEAAPDLFPLPERPCGKALMLGWIATVPPALLACFVVAAFTNETVGQLVAFGVAGLIMLVFWNKITRGF